MIKACGSGASQCNSLMSSHSVLIFGAGLSRLYCWMPTQINFGWQGRHAIACRWIFSICSKLNMKLGTASFSLHSLLEIMFEWELGWYSTKIRSKYLMNQIPFRYVFFIPIKSNFYRFYTQDRIISAACSTQYAFIGSWIFHDVPLKYNQFYPWHECQTANWWMPTAWFQVPFLSCFFVK